MAFCRNCGSELAEDAKFCSKCGTGTEIPIAPSAPMSGSTGLGKELSIHYYSTRMRNYKIFTTCFINIGLLLIALLLGFIPVPGILKALLWIFLIADTIWQVVDIACFSQNVLRICERGVYMRQTTGPFVTEREIPYTEITNVKAVSMKTLTSVEQVQLTTPQGVCGPWIREPHIAAAEIGDRTGNRYPK